MKRAGGSLEGNTKGTDRVATDLDTWYDPTKDDQFFDEIGIMRQDGTWIDTLHKSKVRGWTLSAILLMLIICYIAVLVIIVRIQHKTSHPFNISSSTPCEVNGSPATSEQKATFNTDGSPNLLANDRALLDVALGLLIAGTIITLVGGPAPLFTLGRYHIQDKLSWVSLGWKLLILLFGGMVTFAAQFCVVWAGAGYSKNFDASITCNGANVYDINLHESITTEVKHLAETASILMSIATAALAAVIVILQDGSISAEYDILHWRSKPMKSEDGKAYAPLQGLYDKARKSYSNAEFVQVTVGTMVYDEWVIARIDQSPAIVNAVYQLKQLTTRKSDDSSRSAVFLTTIMDKLDQIIKTSMAPVDAAILEYVRSEIGRYIAKNLTGPQPARIENAAQLSKITAAASSLLLKNPWYSAA